MLKKCDRQTDERTNGQTDLCIELRYAQLITSPESYNKHLRLADTLTTECRLARFYSAIFG